MRVAAPAAAVAVAPAAVASARRAGCDDERATRRQHAVLFQAGCRCRADTFFAPFRPPKPPLGIIRLERQFVGSSTRTDDALVDLSAPAGSDFDLAASASTPLNSLSLVLPPGSLGSGAAFVFRLTVTDPASSGASVATVDVAVATAAAPTGGVLQVFPTGGVALSTRFALNCSNGWGRDGATQPVSYAFAFSGNGGATALQLAPASPSPMLENVTLPGGDVILYCTALSSDGAPSVPATASVAVTQPTFSSDSEADAFTAASVAAAAAAAASGDPASAMQMVAGVTALMRGAGAAGGVSPPPPPPPPPPRPPPPPLGGATPAPPHVAYDAGSRQNAALLSHPPPAPRSAQQVARDAAAAAVVETLLGVIAAAAPAAPTTQLELEASMGLVRRHHHIEQYFSLYYYSFFNFF